MNRHTLLSRAKLRIMAAGMEPTATATETAQPQAFPCSQCGARLEFAPGAQVLKCPYCGGETAIEALATAPIVEYDLHEGLARLRRASANELMSEGHSVRCQGCGAITVTSRQADRCTFCDAPVVLEPGEAQAIVPESLLPFAIDDKRAREAFKNWVHARWFAPNDLKRRARLEMLDGVYIPYWTFDSQTRTTYHGMRGVYYYVTETYTDSNGKTQTRQVRKTRWYPASGVVHVPFDDVLVCASAGLPAKLVIELEPWDLPELEPYDPAYLSGFLAERYQVELDEGFAHAQERMDPMIRRAIERDIGGDEQRISSMNVHHSDTTFKHVLLPLWISSFRYREKVYRVLVNARTGEVCGERPWSWVKITLAVLVAAIVVGVIVYLTQTR